MDARTTLPPPATCDTAPRAEFLRGLRAAVPVMIGFIPFALVLGAQAAQKGLSALEVPLMTGLNFAGGSEFAAVELWTSPPHIALIVAITALVNRKARRDVARDWADSLKPERRRPAENP